MKKIILFILLAVILCWSCSFSHNRQDVNSTSTENSIEQISHQRQTITNMVTNDSVVAAMIVQGYHGKASLSVAYVLLASGKVLRFAPAFVKSPFTLEEAKILLEAKAQGKLVYNSTN